VGRSDLGNAYRLVIQPEPLMIWSRPRTPSRPSGTFLMSSSQPRVQILRILDDRRHNQHESPFDSLRRL
jgi:hypothetical protein